jgi:hypothetical protein
VKAEQRSMHTSFDQQLESARIFAKGNGKEKTNSPKLSFGILGVRKMMIDNDSSSSNSESDSECFRIDFEPNSKPYSNEIDQDVDENSEKVSAIGSCMIMYFNVFGFESHKCSIREQHFPLFIVQWLIK